MKIPDFSTSRVLIVGDVMLDSYVHGSTSRVSPEAPVPVVLVSHEDARLGGAGNVAVNAAALGAATALLALIGPDAAGHRVEAMLAAAGVRCALQRVPGCRTITKQRVLSRNQQLLRLDFEDAFSSFDAAALQQAFSAQLDNVGAVVLSDYEKGTLREVAALIAAARAQGVPVIVDPKGRDFERYRGATLLTPNQSEFEAVAGRCHSDDELVARGDALREQLQLDALLITRSERGMTLLTRQRPPLHLPTRAQEVFDVTGAGDTVVAVLGAALAAGLPLPEAVALSNIAAGVVVAKVGTATVTPAELRRAANSAASEQFRRGVHDEDALLQQVEVARGRGERVVMTNGCFDILHPGHVDYLERARALGDRLVVAVNVDASVRRLKGASRPVNALATRQRMLAALACVDWVVAFAEDTPERLIGRVLPDVLVKGGDYTEAQIAGGAAVKAAGGSVQVLDFVPGHSTTQLIKHIVETSIVIIVTGGAGFIGSNIVSALNARGERDVLVVDDLRNGHQMRNLADLDIADYIDRDDFSARLQAGQSFGAVQAVLHQGACSSTTEWDGQFMMRNNFDYSKRLLHWCQDQRVQFIYASSASVYGSGERGFREDRSCELPINVYAYSKFLFDQYVRRQPGGATQVVGLRYFNVYGPREAHKASMASTAFHFHNQVATSGVARLFAGSGGYGDGEQRRDFIHVDDCVAVNLWFLERPAVSGIFNVGTGRAEPFNAVAAAVLRWHGQGRIDYVPFPDHLKGAYQSFTEADLTALRGCGYDAPFSTVADGVARYLDWLSPNVASSRSS